MNRGITQKAFRKRGKIDRLEDQVRQLQQMVTFLTTKLDQEMKKYEAITSTEREDLPALFGDTKNDSKAVEESRGTVLEGQGGKGEAGSESSEVSQEIECPNPHDEPGVVPTCTLCMAEPSVIEAEGD